MTFMENVNTFDTSISDFMNTYLRQPQIIYGVIVLFIVLYSSQIAPKLPNSVAQVFDNSFFKLFIFIMILWVAQIAPSLAILIAVAFLLSLNYISNKTLWESLDNTTPMTTMMPTPLPTSAPITPAESVNAINNLAIQAMTGQPGVPSKVTNAVNTATANISPTDVAGLAAVQVLGQLASANSPASTDTVQASLTTATQSVNNNLNNTVNPISGIQSLQLLANGATSSTPQPSSVVMTAANTALAAMSSNASSDAVNAISLLAQAAITSAPVDTTTVSQLVDQGIDGITASDSGCYPVRHVDMSKVAPVVDNGAVETYQAFLSNK
jgi:hypothetical protein